MTRAYDDTSELSRLLKAVRDNRRDIKEPSLIRGRGRRGA